MLRITDEVCIVRQVIDTVVPCLFRCFLRRITATKTATTTIMMIKGMPRPRPRPIARALFTYAGSEIQMEFLIEP